MTSRPIKDILRDKAARVDRGLRRFIPKESVLPSVVHRAMRYSVFAGGKRLRPILCLIAAESCGLKGEKVMPTACALEAIHTYSLVHDDLPSMDDDDLRRGQPTNHRVFGEGMAILAGDGLLTYGFELMAQNAKIPGVSAERVVDVIYEVAKAVGSMGMVGGQTADLEAAGDTSKLNGNQSSLVDFIHRRKTGALITASLLAGALLAGANDRQKKCFRNYGKNIGLAFQIADDVLDVVGNKTLLGKSGSDQTNNKLTYPAVYGLDESQRRARLSVARAKKAVLPLGRKADTLNALADYIIARER